MKRSEAKKLLKKVKIKEENKKEGIGLNKQEDLNPNIFTQNKGE